MESAASESSNPGSSTPADSSVADFKEKQTLRFYCKKCGASTPTGLVLGPKGKGRSGDPLSDSEGDSEKNKKDSEKKDKNPRTRVGRYVKKPNSTDNELIDEADWKGPPDPSKDGEFAITVEHHRRLDYYGEVIDEFEELTVVSPPLVKAVRSVVKYFPSIGLDGNSQISLVDPYEPLFFYYDDLCKLNQENPDDAWSDDLKALTHFYSSWVKPAHEKIKRGLEQSSILYDDLWALFRPGDILYATDEAGEPCFHIAIATEFRKPDARERDSFFSIRRFPRLAVDMWHVGWDSVTGMFQRITTTRSIRSYSGSRQISTLPFYPLKYYKGGDAKEIKALGEILQARGNKWKGLVSQRPSCKYYNGPARDFRDRDQKHLSERVVIDGSIDSNPAKRGYDYSYDDDIDYRASRGMIGGTAEARSIEYESSVVGTGLDQEHTHFDDFAKEKEFSELQSQLCPASVMCYAIKSSTWYIISVSQIGDVDWALDAFDHLVLEQDTKEMLAGLVQQHRHNKDRVLADVIESKGKGLVIVLHGAPGVGKTLTAETIAEYTKKPLYPINIGELTSEDDIVEKLQMHFNRASHWDAVLLLDEADVLLEKRSFEDLHRNGIVSVFLRMLEYYEGILFLTTNRLLTMDTAFQSRIHIAIRYPDLTPDARRQIWEKFIYRIDALEGEGKAELLDHLDDMEAWPLNGRQIRNVLSIAESLSLTMHRRRGALRFSQVEKVANETIRFQDFFEDTSKERKSQLGDFGSRQFQERKFRGPR